MKWMVVMYMQQFEANEVVIYGSNGVCRIDALETKDATLYYILRPVHNDRAKYMVPTTSETLVARMRLLPNKQEVIAGIEKAAHEDAPWIKEASARKTYAKHVLEAGTPYELLMLVRAFKQRKAYVASIGKRATSSDLSILRQAQEHLRDEFSAVLDIEPDEVDAFIADHQK